MTNTTDITDEVHVYGGNEYRRGDDGWGWRIEGGGYWYAIGDGAHGEMLDVLHPLPDPPPVTVTLDGTTWTKEDGTRWAFNSVGASFSLRLALNRIVELGGADQ
jgi:hypothetical protein